MQSVIRLALVGFAGLLLASSAFAAPTRNGVVQQLEMRKVQRSLLEQGYPVVASGTLDRQTQRAIEQFQIDHDLEANGRLTEKTRIRILQEDPLGIGWGFGE